jgi:hypothetical protein
MKCRTQLKEALNLLQAGIPHPSTALGQSVMQDLRKFSASFRMLCTFALLVLFWQGSRERYLQSIFS